MTHFENWATLGIHASIYIYIYISCFQKLLHVQKLQNNSPTRDEYAHPPDIKIHSIHSFIFAMTNQPLTLASGFSNCYFYKKPNFVNIEERQKNNGRSKFCGWKIQFLLPSNVNFNFQSHGNFQSVFGRM